MMDARLHGNDSAIFSGRNDDQGPFSLHPQFLWLEIYLLPRQSDLVYFLNWVVGNIFLYNSADL